MLLLSILLGYVLLQLALGVWISRRIRGEDDYLLAGRRLGRAARSLVGSDQARQILLGGFLGCRSFSIDELVLEHRQTIRIVLP